MFSIFKRKDKKYFTYQFLCKSCDVFFYGDNPNKPFCPACGRKGEVYEVYEKDANNGR